MVVSGFWRIAGGAWICRRDCPGFHSAAGLPDTPGLNFVFRCIIDLSIAFSPERVCANAVKLQNSAPRDHRDVSRPASRVDGTGFLAPRACGVDALVSFVPRLRGRNPKTLIWRDVADSGVRDRNAQVI
jgi:hypothetical protein